MISLLGICITIFSFGVSTKSNPVPTSPQKTNVSPYESTIFVPGILEASSQNISVGTSQGGIVKSIFVKPGDKIEKGKPLFQLDDSSTKANLEIKKASLNLAQGSLREASEQWSTVSSLEDERVISKEEINKRKSSYLSAKAKLDQAKAEILLVENTLKMMTVYSPISGDVLQVNIKEGEYVSPGGLSATVMVGVLDPLHVRVDIDESEIPRVNKNARAVGYLRGSKKIKKELQFVRFESFVSSKKATGESDERSDTRVLQALYKMERGVEEFFVGQRMDVYIEEIGVNK